MKSTTTYLVKQIWLRNFYHFRKTWLVSFFWMFLEPLFILFALGYGIGSFIPTIKGVSYIEFFFPGIVCSSSMLISFFASTYDYFSKLHHQKLFTAQILSPIGTREIVIGEVLWSASKGFLSATCISIVAVFLGLIDSLRIFPALFIVFISCLVFAAFGTLVSCHIKNFDQIIYPTSGLIIPMSLFSGVYFPIEQLPYGVNFIVYLFPLAHVTRIVRELILHGFDWWMLLNILYLLILFFILLKKSVKRFDAIMLGE